MFERDTKIAELEARLAALEARPSAGDIDWLKNSNYFKRMEMAADPDRIKGIGITLSLCFGGVLIFILYIAIHG